MAATLRAVLQSQPGTSVATAWPQTPQNSTQRLDLLQIVDNNGQKVLARVDYTGAVTGGALPSLVLTSVAVSSLVLTGVVASTGVYSGTITGGAANAFVGKQVKVLGFATGGNNGTFTITASDATSFTVTPTTQVDETHAGTASVFGVQTATYNGTITGGGASAFAGRFATVTGFVNATNNISSTAISSSSATVVVVPFAGQIAETHAGAVSITAAVLTGTNGTRVGVFQTTLSSSATIAQLFANAFTNLSNQDILQVVSPNGGSIVYYLDSLGVAH